MEKHTKEYKKAEKKFIEAIKKCKKAEKNVGVKNEIENFEGF